MPKYIQTSQKFTITRSSSTLIKENKKENKKEKKKFPIQHSKLKKQSPKQQGMN
jgi:hypothetical protein